METIDFNQVIKENISVVGELLPVANINEDGFLSKKNCIITNTGGNKYAKLSYTKSGSSFGVLLGMFEMDGKSDCIFISFSKTSINESFKITSTRNLSGLCKYVYSDNTVDIYIKNGNLSLLQVGVNSNSYLSSVTTVNESDIPSDANDFDMIVLS